jgi:hypothetical protein
VTSLAVASIAAAIFSAIAAGASALAAWKSFGLAKTTATRAAEAERRSLEHDIDETSRTIQVEARRSALVYERIKRLQDSVFNLAGAFGGSAHAAEIAQTEQRAARIVEIQQQARGIANVPVGGKLTFGGRYCTLAEPACPPARIRGFSMMGCPSAIT